MNKQQLLSTSVCASALALATVVIAATIPLPTKKLTGGTTSVAKLDPAAIPTSGPDAAGKLCNDLPNGAGMDDVTITIDNATAGGVDVGGTPAAETDSGGWHVKFDNDVDSDACVDLKITDIQPDDSGKDVEIKATPSIESSVDGVVIEVNPFPRFGFASNLDLMRTSITAMDHGGGLAFVQNNDGEEAINALEGQVSFPEGANRSLLMVELQTERGEKLPAAITVTDNGFTVDRMTPIAHGDGRLIVLWFDNGAGDVNARLQLSATYAP
ncbi:MAG: hypothetical protein AAGA68_06955 [Pseudomonadota bacterium]